MKMLRFLCKLEEQNRLLQKCACLQPIRNFSDKKSDKITLKGDDSSLTFKKIKENVKSFKDAIAARNVDDIMTEWMSRPQLVPIECDVVIIGGGAIGSSIAYWLKRRVYSPDFKIVVVERDPMYSTASTVLSVGGLRQQFSLRENIEMSLFGAEFIRNANDYLGIKGQDPVDPCFHPYGYLMLASEKGAEKLAENSKLQNFLGAKNILLSAAKLEQMFPWLNAKGVEMGCLGLEKEGWFDPWALLSGLKKKATVLGTKYVYGEAKGFLYGEKSPERTEDKINHLLVQTTEGETHVLQFSIAIVAAGAFSAQIARMAKVGLTDGLRQVSLPVEPRKRYVYCFHCPDGPGLNTPLTIDYSGTYFRREGLAGTYICGRSPEEAEEPPIDDLSVDHDFFEERVWPVLADRVPAFEKLKVKSSWAGYYEYNTFDQNGIIGPHPYYKNLVFATGFSGHGIQQAPAVGRAISELIIDGEYVTIDLSNMNFERIMTCSPMKEVNII